MRKATFKNTPDKKSGDFSKTVVIFCIAAIALYVIVVLVNFLVNGIEPSTLSYCVFGFYGTELGFLAAKRIICGKKEAAKYNGKANSTGDIYTDDYSTENDG